MGWRARLSCRIKRVLLVQALGHKRQHAGLVGNHDRNAVTHTRNEGCADKATCLTFLPARTVLFARVSAKVREFPACQNVFRKIGGQRRTHTNMRKRRDSHRKDQCEGREQFAECLWRVDHAGCFGRTVVEGKKKGRSPSPYLSRNCASRFSRNAPMPSSWSSVAKSAWNMRRSNRRPSRSGTS